ncbi:MAG: hypothetical protein QM699_05310 [Amaricoccus sp.]
MATYTGTSGADTANYSFVYERNIIDGYTGDDLLYGGALPDIINGGVGEDEVQYIFSTASVTVDLTGGRGTGGIAAGDTYISIENVTGSGYDDALLGNGAFNVLFGRTGNDLIRGGAGGDRMDGETGTDTLDYRTSDLGVQVDLSSGATFGGDAQSDEIHNFERVWGSNFADVLDGDGGRNVLRGFDGNDVLSGLAGADTLQGLVGNDRLTGGLGGDALVGGEGADIFSFRAPASRRRCATPSRTSRRRTATASTSRASTRTRPRPATRRFTSSSPAASTGRRARCAMA